MSTYILVVNLVLAFAPLWFIFQSVSIHSCQLLWYLFSNNLLIIFLFQCWKPVTPIDNADRHLQLPAPVKQFLISPPSSPPIGWEPRVESAPLINYDLIAAIASLSPGTIKRSRIYPKINLYRRKRLVGEVTILANKNLRNILKS